MLIQKYVKMLKEFDAQFTSPVCGIDEVGRGPLCGPVTSACVHIPSSVLDNPLWDSINDSKKISAVKREKLFEPLKEFCFYGIAEASAQEIDQLNIHHATLLAMKRAYEDMIDRFDVMPNIALIDGKFAPDISCQTQTVIKGDGLSLCIAAASIIAKVTRDKLMKQLHVEHPHYGWDTNSGYGTKVHMEGLQSHGLTPFHRLSFAPCAKAKANK